MITSLGSLVLAIGVLVHGIGGGGAGDAAGGGAKDAGGGIPAEEIRSAQERILVVALSVTVALAATLIMLHDAAAARRICEATEETDATGSHTPGAAAPFPPLLHGSAATGLAAGSGASSGSAAEDGGGLFGYGLTWLPVPLDAGVPAGVPNVAADDPLNKTAAQIAEHGFALPDWMTPEHCVGCGRSHAAVCFLCPTCQLLTPRDRVHLVFELLEEGDPTRAWAMAEAIITDVRAYRAAQNRN